MTAQEAAPAEPPVLARRAAPARSSAYASFYGHLLWPAWDAVVRGRTTRHYLAFVEAMQWRSPEAIERYQIGALRSLLVHAGLNIPYWRELFRRLGFDGRDVRRREDLAALPVLTRDIVRERYRDLIDPAHAGQNLKKGTSGSTGSPLKFEYSQESECWRQAIRTRGYSWSGYRPGLPVFYYWAVVSEPGALTSLKIRVDRALKRETFFDSMRQDEAARRRALDLLRRTRPAVVICYTQSCAQFARWVLDRGLRDWGDIPVLCGAEAVLAADRAVLSRVFGPEVFETYGSRETMLIAAECEAHEGMHLMEENLLVEVARRGAPIPTGDEEAQGDVLVTDLHNFGMPLIRYENGDVAGAIHERRCRCGRGLRRLKRVDGRRAETLVDGEGNPVPGIVFHVLFSDARQEIVRQFQAVQKADGDVVLKVVRGQDFTEERFDAVARRFGSYLKGVRSRVEFCDAIPPCPNGKMRTIVVER
ncbi:MAG: phenylacetate--CoA ligase family protein [Polyangiaceae bacterium]